MLDRVILALDNLGLRGTLSRQLTGSGTIVDVLSDQTSVWERLGRESCDLLVISRTLIPPPAVESISVFSSLPDAPVLVLVVDKADAREDASFLEAGCDAVLTSDLPAENIAGVLTAFLHKRRGAASKALDERGALGVPRLSDFVSHSPAMQAFMNTVYRVATSDASLLILGETGVGKERLARAIHAESSRRDGPFVPVNCGALPEGLLESELFGHEEGAFTGATRNRRGCFELAHQGTIFLDEIGETPLHLQVKLLRVLQERCIQRVGGERSIPIDVRLMAATNRNLEQEVLEGRFRRDLYYRLGVVTLEIPPLVERVQDIPELAESYIDFLRPRIGREVYGIAPDALIALERYAWPGNVRELINVIERAMLLCNGDEIQLADLPAAISHASSIRDLRLDFLTGAEEEVPEGWAGKSWKEVRTRTIEAAEKAYLHAVLQETGGRINQTAKRAGIAPRSLYGKMKKHGLRKEAYRGKAE